MIKRKRYGGRLTTAGEEGGDSDKQTKKIKIKRELVSLLSADGSNGAS